MFQSLNLIYFHGIKCKQGNPDIIILKATCNPLKSVLRPKYQYQSRKTNHFEKKNWFETN